jgi:hypothetical protein
MRHKNRLKSISVYVPIEKVEANLSEIGFLLMGSNTIVANGKFWNKMLYVNQDERISVSEEIGDAYPKDPIITICGSKETILSIIEGVKS